MKKKILASVTMSVCFLALIGTLLVGCAGNTTNTAGNEQQQNRAYMSQVNEIVMQVSTDLDGFVNAVSDGDIVNIRTTANTAMKQLAKLSSLEAPETLSGIQDKYRSGSDKLADALNQYVELYADIQAGSVDATATAGRVAKIQSLYDEGVADLKAGDEEAASL